MRTLHLRLICLFSAISTLTLLLVPGSIADSTRLTSAPPLHQSSSERSWNLVGWMRTQRAFTAPKQQKIVALLPATAPAEHPLLAVVKKEDIRPQHQRLADALLRALPAGCRDNLKNFYIRYDHPKNRGLGGKTTIIVDGSFGDAEVMALITHECGHVIHSNLPGTPSSGASGFKDGNMVFYKDSPIVSFFSLSWANEKVLKSGLREQDFVSEYAQSGVFEDFAETFAAYALHPDAMEEQAKTSVIVAKKLAWMRTHLPMPNPISVSEYRWNGTPPWDITRLGYKWIGSTQS